MKREATQTKGADERKAGGGCFELVKGKVDHGWQIGKEEQCRASGRGAIMDDNLVADRGVVGA